MIKINQLFIQFKQQVQDKKLSIALFKDLILRNNKNFDNMFKLMDPEFLNSKEIVESRIKYN